MLLFPTRKKMFVNIVHVVILTCDLFISMLLHLQVSSTAPPLSFFTWLMCSFRNQSIPTLLPQNSKMHGGRDQTKGLNNFCAVFF